MQIVEIIDPPFSGKLFQQLTRQLYEELTSITRENRSVDVETVVATVQEFLDNNTESHVNIDVSHVCNDTLLPHNAVVSGIFDYDDLSFEFYISVSNNDSIIEFDAKQLTYDILDTLEHEMIHYLQSSKREGRHLQPGRSGTREVEYMTRPDEVDAYALNIARELLRMYRNIAPAIATLRTVRTTKNIPKDLVAYQHIFDADDEVFKRLFKRVYLYLVELSK